MISLIASNILFNARLYFLSISILFCISVGCVKNSKLNGSNKLQKLDYIDSLLTESRSNKGSSETKFQNLDKAYDLVKNLDQDSLKTDYLFKISNQLYSLKKYSEFKKVNLEFLKYSIEDKDSLRIADFYWNMGSYYSDIEVLDSAYYNFGRARLIFKQKGHIYYTAKMEYNIAYVLRRSKNYIESEAFAFRAISNLKNLNKHLLLYRCYNHLGLLYNDLEEFSFSIEYHLKAMDLIPKLPKNGIYLERSLNNLSLVYQKQQKYGEAIEVLNKALLNKSLRSQHPNLYAKLIDNRAYCRFLNGDQRAVEDEFNKALYIRDSLGNEAGIGISKMHLSELYLKTGDSLKAFRTAREAHDLTKSLGLNRDILSSLVLLSQADPSHATTYMDSYIKLNDSLLLEERKVRNKFTRIQFETEDYIAANEDLKKKNIWISLTSVFGVASLSFLFFGYRQKAKNRTLLLQQQQQKANEEIYDLMLKQQNREEEGRIQERIRISEELHDGVLARLFSVRIGMGFLKFAERKKDENRFSVFLKELQSVERDIRDLSHALKNDDLSSKKDFPKLLFELLEEQSKIGNFTYTLEQESSIAWNRVDEKIKINLYRTVQEAICNVLKYANCSEIKLRLERRNNLVQIYIVDDGIGFDTNKRHKGIGLKNMKSRAKCIGAKISIKSTVQKGTQIKISIPTKTLYHEPTT